MKTPKQPSDELARAIKMRERSIANQKKKIEAIRLDADAEIATIEKNIAKNVVLLDALVRGSLKP